MSVETDDFAKIWPLNLYQHVRARANCPLSGLPRTGTSHLCMTFFYIPELICSLRWMKSKMRYFCTVCWVCCIFTCMYNLYSDVLEHYRSTKRQNVTQGRTRSACRTPLMDFTVGLFTSSYTWFMLFSRSMTNNLWNWFLPRLLLPILLRPSLCLGHYYKFLFESSFFFLLFQSKRDAAKEVEISNNKTGDKVLDLLVLTYMESNRIQQLVWSPTTTQELQLPIEKHDRLINFQSIHQNVCKLIHEHKILGKK